MSFLVISHGHGLLPVVHRLRLAKENAQLIVWKQNFERAWDGQVEKFPRGPKGEVPREAIDRAATLAQEGSTTIVTDMTSLEFPVPVFGRLDPPNPPQLVVRLGAWFDGQHLHDHHLLVCDVGAWPGGMGPSTLGGLTLVRPDLEKDIGFVEDLWQQIVDELKARDFRGLVQADVEQSLETGQLELSRWEAGWPWLHTHAWLSELSNLPAVLRGEPPEVGEKFTVVAPVTIPPWPVWPVQAQARAATPTVEGLAPAELGRLFWHDVVVDGEHQQLRGAGLDGLLAVARGAAGTLELARTRTLDTAARLRVPNKQFRPDVGSAVGAVLAGLELQYGVVL